MLRDVPNRKALCALSAFLFWFTAMAPAADAPPAAEPVQDAFQANVDRIFADGRADIRVTFGYDNYEGLKDPCDPERAQQFMKYLTNRSFAPIAPTPDLAQALGVPEDSANVRAFGGMTTDGRRMRVALIWSSLTTTTSKNIGSEYSKQLAWSGVALNFMRKSITDSEVMIYVGHSRGGGGPDTYPPVTLSGPNVGIQQVDFAYYRRNIPGLLALEPTFERAQNTPGIILWTGCNSQQKFGSWLAARVGGKPNPTSLILATRLTNHIPGAPTIGDADEAIMAAVTLMEAIILRHTRSEFERRLWECEIPDLRHPETPEWKVTLLPGRKPATAKSGLAGAQ